MAERLTTTKANHTLPVVLRGSREITKIESNVAPVQVEGGVILHFLQERFEDLKGLFHSTDATQSDGKIAARVTSAVYSPQLKAPLALAYVRREHQQPGSKLTSDRTSAEVIALPLV